MDLTLVREASSGDCTHGDLLVDGVWQAFTLEDVVRSGPKVQHETAIPAGRYEVVITRSQRFERMLPLLLNVPDFTGIRIHPGNTKADTSGCILVGLSRTKEAVLSSQAAMTALQPKMATAIARGDRVWITILDAARPQQPGDTLQV